MRHLYAGRAGRRQVAAGAQPRPQRDRGPLLAGRESLPVHRLRQDRPRGHGDRCRHAGGCPMNDMTSDTGNKWIGKSTIRPDGSDKVTGRDRKSVVEGKSVSVRVDLGGRRTLKKKKKNRLKQT